MSVTIIIDPRLTIEEMAELYDVTPWQVREQITSDALRVVREQARAGARPFDPGILGGQVIIECSQKCLVTHPLGSNHSRLETH